MDFTRPWKSKQSLINETFLTRSSQPLIRKALALMFNGVMWSYMVLIYAFFITAFFNTDLWVTRWFKQAYGLTNASIQSFSFMTFLGFAGFLSLLTAWRVYNKRRFGHLRRRTYPPMTTTEEILALQLIGAKDYQTLHENKVIVFERSPIAPLLKHEKLPKTTLIDQTRTETPSLLPSED